MDSIKNMNVVNKDIAQNSLLERLDHCISAASSKNHIEWKKVFDRGMEYDYENNYRQYNEGLANIVQICVENKYWDDLLARFDDNYKVHKFAKPLLQEIIKQNYKESEAKLVEKYKLCTMEIQKLIMNALVQFKTEQGKSFISGIINKPNAKGKYIEIAKEAYQQFKVELLEVKLIKNILEDNNVDAEKLVNDIHPVQLAKEIAQLSDDDLVKVVIFIKNSRAGNKFVQYLEESALGYKNSHLARIILMLWGVHRDGIKDRLLEVIFNKDCEIDQLKELGDNNFNEIIRLGLKNNYTAHRVLELLLEDDNENTGREYVSELNHILHAGDVGEAILAAILLSNIESKVGIDILLSALGKQEYKKYWEKICVSLSKTKGLDDIDLMQYPEEIRELFIEVWNNYGDNTKIQISLSRIIDNCLREECFSVALLWLLKVLRHNDQIQLLPILDTKKLLLATGLYLDRACSILVSPAGLNQTTLMEKIEELKYIWRYLNELDLLAEFYTIEKMENYPPLVLKTLLDELIVNQDINMQAVFLARLLKTARLWEKASLSKDIEEFAAINALHSYEFSRLYGHALDDPVLSRRFYERILNLASGLYHENTGLKQELATAEVNLLREIGKTISLSLENLELFLQSKCREEEAQYRKKVILYFKELREALSRVGLEGVEKDYKTVPFKRNQHRLIQKVDSMPKKVVVKSLGLKTREAGVIQYAAVTIEGDGREE